MTTKGDYYTEGRSDEVRNPDGTWINTKVFKETGEQFMKHGYYIADPWDSPAWTDFWFEERQKCIHGISVGGFKITGDHYYYLNFSPIMKVDIENMMQGVFDTDKVEDFPDFWDGDYNYFWIREIARRGVLSPLLESQEDIRLVLEMEHEDQMERLKELFESLNLEVIVEPNYLKGGYNLIVGKSRRKGFTYKAASIASKNYFTVPNSLTILGAYDKKYLYPKGIFTDTYNNINFINENTGWVFPSDVTDQPGQGHVKASYTKRINGVDIEKGFKSSIMAPSFQDNSDAARGKGARDVFFEEAGAFGKPGLLKKSYKSTIETAGAGIFKTGLVTIFGTSGDMEKGTADYADMFYRPLAFGLMPFQNIWDENSSNLKCGYFHPANLNMEGFYDSQGNSDAKGAKEYVLKSRKILEDAGATTEDIQEKMQEIPLSPGEAFAVISVNNFPVTLLNSQIAKVKGNGWQESRSTAVNLEYTGENEVTAIPILDGSANPITSYRNPPKDKRGCVLIYEQPGDNPPAGLFKIGYDPVQQETGTSLASIVVYKGVQANSPYHSILAAEYIGRTDHPEDMDRIAEKLAVFYNAQIMHENMVAGVKTYFQRRKKLNLLAPQPDAVISKNIKKSKVARVYGCHMDAQGRMADAGERYTKDWLLTVLDYDENGDPVTVIDRTYSLRMLEELVSYHRDGNFDHVSALFMCMFQLQEEVIGKEYGGEKTSRMDQLVETMGNRYPRRK